MPKGEGAVQGRTTLHVSLAFVPPSLSLLTKRHAGRIHSSRGGGAVLSGAGSSPRSAIGFSQLYVFKKKKKKEGVAWLDVLIVGKGGAGPFCFSNGASLTLL